MRKASRAGHAGPGLERAFDPTFAAKLALREKQIQQSYRPIIGIHKWFARRPGTVFRCLLLAEFNGSEPLDTSYWRTHQFTGVVADPFMGGGTPIFEANRLGLGVVGTDINPMAFWIVRQALAPLDIAAFAAAAADVAARVENTVGQFYSTLCTECGHDADVKYFIWVKTATCPECGVANDLFPGYLLAEAERHPKHVVACARCGALNEFDHSPTQAAPGHCASCGEHVFVEGPARRRRIACRACRHEFRFPAESPRPPSHRMWALEYSCDGCRAGRSGRFFKAPDAADHRRYARAVKALGRADDLPIPEDAIPPGDETDRLRRWGYRRYREMFNDRQLLGLGTLLKQITSVPDASLRHALLTVFSDFLRYQNMLCRYDTYALKCQDIFSVHGYPVGLVQCENNLIGIPGVGSGAFRHFVEKYIRAKSYCITPFETAHVGKRKIVVPVVGETIRAEFVDRLPMPRTREAMISAAPAATVALKPNSLDGVFTDPPYFDNVQYAELMDFCYVWLRRTLSSEFDEFAPSSTRAAEELTGNATLGRDLRCFTTGLSEVYQVYAKALKSGAPIVFTYHHNSPLAYVPLVVAILDAGLDCTATLPAVAEMTASLHIAGTNSSVLDTVFVCRKAGRPAQGRDLVELLQVDISAMRAAGVRVTEGDRRCLAAGHIARLAINDLRPHWKSSAPLEDRMRVATKKLNALTCLAPSDSWPTVVPLPPAVEEVARAPSV
ncbi:MAG: DUF1156 domain-containing protein [Planctomycetota bacterium]